MEIGASYATEKEIIIDVIKQIMSKIDRTNGNWTSRGLSFHALVNAYDYFFGVIYRQNDNIFYGTITKRRGDDASTGPAEYTFYYDHSSTNVVCRSNSDFYTHIVTTTGTDLDNYMDSGVYYFDSARAPLNVPGGSNGWLFVMGRSENTVKQIWYRCGTADTNDFQFWTRTKVGGIWSSWRRQDNGGLSFSKNSAGDWGYTPPGGSFIPFKKEAQLLFSGVGNGTYDCTSISGYSKLTAKNFLLDLKTTKGWYADGTGPLGDPTYGAVDGTFETEVKNVTKSYNASTGKLTISNLSHNNYYNHGNIWNKNVSVTTTVDIYCVS